jgi:succinoglycan biosynthesis protein ExoA
MAYPRRITSIAVTEPVPGVSYVMPILNEAGYVEAAVRSILDQDYPGPTEVVLALGPSTDGTNEIVARMQRADPRIQSVDNPKADVPNGLNLAIGRSRHPVIVRVDAHTELPDGYTRRAVQTLNETGAANVGGVMVAKGRPGLQAAVARAYNSRWGLGGGAYHSEDEPPGPAESAFLGVMRADALRSVGLFDPTLRRGQDWELNHRLRQSGHLVWLDPSLRVQYWPRDSVAALWRQMYATGIWRGEIVRRLHVHNSPRYFAPPTLVVATGAAVVLAPFTGTGRPVRALARLAALGPTAYLAVIGGVAARNGGSPGDRARFGLVLATMHYAWGAGFLVGLARGARDTVDTSRIAPAVESSTDQPSQPSS